MLGLGLYVEGRPLSERGFDWVGALVVGRWCRFWVMSRGR